MAKLRVVHYLNQFFAGIGGEEKADAPPRTSKGGLGPAQALNRVLAEDGEVVATVFCGDNYITERPDAAMKRILDIVRPLAPDVLVAGPAFGSGRYGLACGLVCSRVREELGIPTVTGVHRDSPAAEAYRGKVLMVSTDETAVGMGAAIGAMARIAVKLGRHQALGPADEEGYIPTGRVVNEFAQKTVAARLVEMLLKKVRGQPFQTEWPLPKPDRVPPAPAISVLKGAKIALVSESGVVPKGNPDGLPSGWADKWVRYSIEGTSDLTPDRWQSVHGGFDTTEVNRDPDRVVPLDALRELEKERAIGELHDYIYVTVGNLGYVSTMRKFSQEIAQELQKAGVQGVILTGT